LSEKIDGEYKKDLLEFSIYFHDIGKFVVRKITHESDGEISFSFKGHEQASYEVLKSEEMVG
jgi:CRISPR/Cas system-associated endonuclease Cas3-HD